MPSSCAVMGCSKRAERDRARFFKIPKPLKNRGIKLDALSKERRESWVTALRRGTLSETFLKNARICGDHFISGEPAKLEDKDDPDWVPSVKMGYFDEPKVKRHAESDTCQTKRVKTEEVNEAEPSTSDCNTSTTPPLHKAE